MRYYIKQKVFSWRDRFTIKDSNGQDVYFVESELFSWGKKLYVTDRNGNEVLYIQLSLNQVSFSLATMQMGWSIKRYQTRLF